MSESVTAFRPDPAKIYEITLLEGDVDQIWNLAHEGGRSILLLVRDQADPAAPEQGLSLILYSVAWEGGDKENHPNEVVVRGRIHGRTADEPNPVIGFCWDDKSRTGLLNVVLPV